MGDSFHAEDTKGRNPTPGSLYACSGVTRMSSFEPWGIPMIQMIRDLAGGRVVRGLTLTTP